MTAIITLDESVIGLWYGPSDDGNVLACLRRDQPGVYRFTVRFRYESKRGKVRKNIYEYDFPGQDEEAAIEGIRKTFAQVYLNAPTELLRRDYATLVKYREALISSPMGLIDGVQTAMNERDDKRCPECGHSPVRERDDEERGPLWFCDECGESGYVEYPTNRLVKT